MSPKPKAKKTAAKTKPTAPAKPPAAKPAERASAVRVVRGAAAKRKGSAAGKAAARVAATNGKPARNGRNLVIVESPAKARTIQKYLGAGFEVKASNGHVRDLPKSKLGVEIENGFEPSYILIKGKAKIVKDLKASAHRASTVYLAPDPDREGEAIAWHLAETLGSDASKIQRLAFYEITKRGIEAALLSPRTIDMQKVHAQQARRVLDRLVGYKVSPFLWKTIRYGLSAGRVQSVALRLICEREDEIQKFVQREYWTIDADLASPKGDVFRARVQKKGGEKLALENEAQAKAEAAALGKERFVVSNIRTQEKKRNPLPPFITSTLQQEAFRRYKYSGQKTMVIAQQLYEGIDVGSEGSTGLITYMRTDSTRVSPDALAEVRDFIRSQFGDAYLPAEPRQYRSRETSQDAHESVRPTSVLRTPASVKSHLDHDQYRIYELIWQRFAASQMNPALVLTTTAEITAGSYLLRASGSRVLFDGFARAYSTTLIEETGPEASKLPTLAVNDALAMKEILPEQHFTEPPPHYTEATLVKTLEEKGIGRPSTYATIVSTILSRDYVTRDRGKLVPTELGMTVWKLLGKMFSDVFDVEFTARLEGQLDRIETGKDAWTDVVSGFYTPFQSDLTKAESQQEKVRASLVQETETPCPKCGSKMVKKFGRSGPFLACPRYPECKATMPLEEEGVPAEAPPTALCPICGSAMRVRTGRFGKFLACSTYPECKGTRPFTLQIACPKCVQGELVERRTRRGKPFYGCSRYPECDFAIWDRPVKQKCPNCDSPILVQKHTKSKGDFLQCPKCKTRVETESTEALSGTLDR